MQLLLVFSREDPFIVTLKNAALKCGYHIKCCRNIEEIHEAFKRINYDLVFIDCRRSPSVTLLAAAASAASNSNNQQQQQSLPSNICTNNQYDYENICRFIRKLFHYTVIVALTNNFEDRDLPSVLPMLKIGFNKTLTETTNLNRCINELYTLEYGEVKNVKRLQAAHVIFTALEFSNDSIEIFNDHLQLLYANHTFEKFTGHNLNDICGKEYGYLHETTKSEDLAKLLQSNNRALECDLHFRKANNDESEFRKSILIPIKFQGEANKIQNYVTITRLSDKVYNYSNSSHSNNNNDSVSLTSNDINSSLANNNNNNGRRSISLPAKKSYDFQKFANVSLALTTEEQPSSNTNINTSTTNSGSQFSSPSSSSSVANNNNNNKQKTISSSSTTPSLSTKLSSDQQQQQQQEQQQEQQQQSDQQQLLLQPQLSATSITPSTTTTTLYENGECEASLSSASASASSAKQNLVKSNSSKDQNSITKSSPEFQQDLNPNFITSKNQRKLSYDVRSTTGSNAETYNSTIPRRHSSTRFHPQTIEAPIRKVINIIMSAQERTNIDIVRESLEKALDILKSTELYNPNLFENDMHTSDLVSGLMSNGLQRRLPIGILGPGSKTIFNVANQPTQTYVKNLSPEIVELLDNDKNWDFDIIALERLTNKRPLVTLGWKIMNRYDVCEHLKIDEAILINWLTLIESNYKSTNPYHNSTHASDVLHATAYFISSAKINDILDASDKVAALIAAAVHDLNHPGKTNAFLCNSNSDLAILYNDQAVLENHHASLAFQLTRQSNDANIFKNLNRDEYRALRSIIIDMVLATEMSKHFEHLNKFVNKFCASDDAKPAIKSIETLRMTENKVLIKRIIIKCADVSNPCRPLDVCKEWSQRIAEEYFEQTEEEKANNLPVVMPTFDKQTCNIPKAQISFIEYFINDMFEAWDDFSDIPEVISYLQANTSYWRECSETKELARLQQHAARTALEHQSSHSDGVIQEDNENEKE